MPEPLESGDEVLIEYGHFSIQDQGGFWESSDHPGQLTKSPRVIPTVPAEELDPPITLTSHDSPSVVLFFKHPSLAVEGTGDESGVHQGDVGGEPTSSISR